MSAPHATPLLDRATEKWRALALRRHAYYLELLESGRWRRYFDEAEFTARLRDVMTATRAWNGLAKDVGRPVEPETRSAA